MKEILQPHEKYKGSVGYFKEKTQGRITIVKTRSGRGNDAYDIYHQRIMNGVIHMTELNRYGSITFLNIRQMITLVGTCILEQGKSMLTAEKQCRI
jgi:hypothetical protein